MNTKWLKFYTHRLQAAIFGDASTSLRGVLGTKGRAYGIDLSRWEPRFHYTQAQPGLIDFCFIKATQDVVWVDTAFEQLYMDIQPLRVTGAYHYLSSGYRGRDQAVHFLKTVGMKRFEVLIVDFEETGNTMNDDFVRACYEWLVYVSQERPNQKVVLYTNPNLYDSVLNPTAWRLWGRDVFADWDLWIAQYYWMVNPDGEPTMKTRKDWKVWQMSAAGDPAVHGTDGWCDIDVFNGTLEELSKWAQVETDPPIPPEEGEEMAEILLGTIVTGELNVRGMPTSTGNTPIRTVKYGQKVIASARQNGWWKLSHIDHVKVPVESWAYEGGGNGYIRQDDAIVSAGNGKPVIQVSHVLQAPGYPDLTLGGEWKPNVSN